MCLIRAFLGDDTTTLSINPFALKFGITLLIVDRLTCSSRASPFQSGRANPVVASIRRSSAFRMRSSMSTGSLDGRPLGLPVALCFLFMINDPHFRFSPMPQNLFCKILGHSHAAVMYLRFSDTMRMAIADSTSSMLVSLSSPDVMM